MLHNVYLNRNPSPSSLGLNILEQIKAEEETFFSRAKECEGAVKALTGLRVKEFETLFKLVEEPLKQAGKLSEVESLGTPGAGRPNKYSWEDYLFMLFIYKYLKISQLRLAGLFNIHNSNVSRLIGKTESVVQEYHIFDTSRQDISRKVEKLLSSNIFHQVEAVFIPDKKSMLI